MSLYVHGQTKIPEPIPEEKIKKQRELEQHQRYLERKIRRYKRLEAGTMDVEQAKLYTQKRKQSQKELSEFIAENDDVLKRDYFREKVYTEDLTKGGESGIIDNRIIEQLQANPQSLSSYTPKTLKDALEQSGFEIKPLARGSLKGIAFEQGGGYKINFGDGGLIQYHPDNGSHHGGAYYKISTGKGGTHRYGLDGKAKK